MLPFVYNFHTCKQANKQTNKQTITNSYLFTGINRVYSSSGTYRKTESEHELDTSPEEIPAFISKTFIKSRDMDASR